MKELRVDVWSDIACPWCYVGKRRLESALARFPHAASVRIDWRAFELDPHAPRVQPAEVSYAERLAKKYATSTSAAEAMIRRMVGVAAADGVTMRFDIIRPGNTFDAHRLIHFAKERGKQAEAKERLLRAYLSEGEAIGDRDALERLGAELGLDRAELRAVLAGDAFAREVRADEEEARGHGIGAVPCFVFARRYVVSGAQSSEVFARVLEKAWSELPEVVAAGEACGQDGCAGA
jgi:predicted DsbA family dithiol-disulfide isomerase